MSPSFRFVDWEFELTRRLDHAHFAAAASLLRLMRAKGSIEDVETELAAFIASILTENASLNEEEAEAIKRDMAVQTVLEVGSRSFSHFLNVLER